MQNTNGYNGSGMPPNRVNRPYTPTPQGANFANINMGIDTPQTGRYLPPQKRIPAEDIVRPESSMSNATFLTQPPMPQYTPQLPLPPRGPPAAYPPPRGLPPRGPYRYGPSQLVDPFTRFDAALGSAQGRPDIQRRQGNASIYGFGDGTSFRNGGVRPGINMPQTFLRNGGQQPAFPSHPGSDASSNKDAAIAGNKADHIARMIKSGAFENASDVDFGNPGPSRHPGAVAPSSSIPHRRGHIAAAAGTASNDDNPNAAVRNANIRGSSAAFLGTFEYPLPGWYKEMNSGGVMACVVQVFADLPVIEGCRVARPTTAGVIRIRNIPYITSKSEILAFMGRNAQIVHQPIGSPFHAIHITMNRLSGKTLDCFIEVESVQEATLIHNQFAKRIAQGRHTKLSDRAVIVEQSTQQEMMSELFPLGKYVTWHGNVPKIDMTNLEEFWPGAISVGFEGFLNEEEMAHMIRHVEMPQRSPFAQRCWVRPYECIIYTLHKYPWYAVDNVLCHERDYLHRVVLKAVDALMQLLRNHGGSGNSKTDCTMPTSTTLKELVIAGLTCPGFSEFQKSRIIRHLHNANFGQYSVTKGLNLKFGGNHVYSENWPFTVLIKKPGAKDELLEFLASLLRDATANELTMADLHSMQTDGNLLHPFGKIAVQYDKNKSIAEMGRLELRAIEKTLLEVLPRTHADAIAAAVQAQAKAQSQSGSHA